MDVDLIGGSYESKYKSLNAQRTINWFPVYDSQQEKNKSPKALFPTPGATTFVTLPGRYFRGLFVANAPTVTKCFAVVDTTLYEVKQSGSYTTIGTLSDLASGTDYVYMTIDSNSVLGIWHYTASYNYNLLTGALTEVQTNAMNPSAQFPGAVTYATYFDTFVFVVSGGLVWPSLAGSSSTWDSTYSFASTFSASPVIAVAGLRNLLYVFTMEDVSIYYNGGSTPPFIRQDRSSLSIGLVAKDSLATCDSGFFFLGRNVQGECNVYFYSVDSGISNITEKYPNIAWRINSLGETPLDAFGYTEYNKDGQLFYYLTIPDLKTTLVYNLANNEWHERTSKLDNNDSNGDNVYSIFRAKTMVNFNGMHLYADIYSGKIFLQDATDTIFTENGNTVIRDRFSQTFSQSQQLISVSQLELECDPGQWADSLDMQISYSWDGGVTFKQPVIVPLGDQGSYDYRFRIFKIGAARRWVVWIRCSDPANLMIQSAVAKGTISNY